VGVWPAAGFEMRPAADLGVLGLRPMDGVACEKTRKERKGRKFGSLRE